MSYKPWFFALNVHAQGFFFCLIELWHQTFKKYKYNREILQLSDGGEIALDWIIHPSDKEKKENVKQQIILLFPGINGDGTKLYAFSMQEECIKNGFDLVIVNWRGMGGVPLKVSNHALDK